MSDRGRTPRLHACLPRLRRRQVTLLARQFP
jgi:hypothetical protein